MRGKPDMQVSRGLGPTPAEAEPELLMLVLQQIVDVALLPLPPEQALVELVARFRDTLAGDCATLYLVDGSELVAHASVGFRRGHTPGEERIALGAGIVGGVAADRKARLIGDLTPNRPVTAGGSLRSLLLAPLVVSGQVTGVVQVSAYEPDRFVTDDLRLLRLVADRIALAVEQFRSRERELEAAAALRESEQRIRAVLESAADGILTVLEDGQVESANPQAERMFGFPPGGMVGTDFAALIPAAPGDSSAPSRPRRASPSSPSSPGSSAAATTCWPGAATAAPSPPRSASPRSTCPDAGCPARWCATRPSAPSSPAS